MSPEILLLLFFFVVLPLLQQLLQYARQQRAPQRGAGPPSTGGERATMEPRPRAQQHREPPEIAGHELSDAVSRQRSAPPDAARSAMPKPPARQSPRRRIAVGGLHSRAGLGRGIVLMTILGPCRANDRYEWPERAGRR